MTCTVTIQFDANVPQAEPMLPAIVTYDRAVHEPGERACCHDWRVVDASGANARHAADDSDARLTVVCRHCPASMALTLDLAALIAGSAIP